MSLLTWLLMALPLAFVAAFFILRWVFPCGPPPRPLDELKKDYSVWGLVAFGLFLVFGAAASAPFWVVFWGLGQLTSHRFHDAEIVLTPMGLLYLVPAVATGALVGVYLMDLVIRYLLGPRYEEFIYYENAAVEGFNSTAIQKPFFILWGCICLLMLFLTLDNYAVFTPDKIVASRLLSVVEEEWDYSQVEGIFTAPALIAPNGSIRERREYVIHFSDDGKWTTNLAPGDPSLEQKADIAEYVSKKSGKEIVELEVLAMDDVY